MEKIFEALKVECKTDGGYLLSEAHLDSLQSVMDSKDEHIRKLEGLVRDNVLSIANNVSASAGNKKQAPVVQIGGSEYKFRYRAFYFKAVRYTAEDAATKSELLQQIIADKGQTILKELF